MAQTTYILTYERAQLVWFGWDYWLRETGACAVQSDAYGDLYRVSMDGGEIDVAMVTNSTPESNGKRKRYALTSPPGNASPHAAIARSFGLAQEDYAPSQET